MARHCAISVDVAGVEPALDPLNGHILVGGRTPFADAEVSGFRGRTNPDRQRTKNCPKDD